MVQSNKGPVDLYNKETTTHLLWLSNQPEIKKGAKNKFFTPINIL